MKLAYQSQDVYTTVILNTSTLLRDNQCFKPTNNYLFVQQWFFSAASGGEKDKEPQQAMQR